MSAISVKYELIGPLRTYIERIFANPNSERVSKAGQWLAGDELPAQRYELARQEFVQAITDAELRAWCGKRITQELWDRFLLAQRQARFKKKAQIVSLKIRPEVHQKLAEYCQQNGLTLDDGIIELLKGRHSDNG